MLRFILLTALYVLGTWYADAFIGGSATVTLFWPAAGVAFAAVLLYGWRGSLFIPVADLLAHLTFVEVPPDFLPFSVLGNFLGALVGAHVVHARGVQPQISVTSGFGMLRGALAMVLVSAAIGTSGMVFASMIPFSDLGPALLKWSMGDLLGILCIAPSMLLVGAPGSRNPDLPEDADYSSLNEKLAWMAWLDSSPRSARWTRSCCSVS